MQYNAYMYVYYNYNYIIEQSDVYEAFSPELGKM